MNFLWRQPEQEASDRQMARAAEPVDLEAVSKYSEALLAADIDQGSFDAVYDRLIQDKSLRSAEVAAVAMAYVGSVRRVTSKKAALEAIRKKFVERVRSNAKRDLAAKSRPW